MSQVESKYDEFLANLQKTLRVIDPTFATRLMYLERKIPKTYHPTVKPHVSLTIRYKQGTDRNKKQFFLRDKYGFMVELLDEPHEILCMGYMDMGMVERIAVDPDIELITGKTSTVLSG